jgi:hypothetical protein
LRACWLRTDSDFSIGRHLRDILSSPIMISNDRILADLAMASLPARRRPRCATRTSRQARQQQK